MNVAKWVLLSILVLPLVELAVFVAVAAEIGLGWALLSFFDATLTPGIRLMIDACRLRERLAGADLCLTGEGSFDTQSLAGKQIVAQTFPGVVSLQPGPDAVGIFSAHPRGSDEQICPSA